MSMFQYWGATVYEAGIFPLKYFWSRGRKGQGVGWPGLLDAVVKNMKVSESSSKDLCQVLTAGLHNGDLELNWFLLRQKPQFFILVLTMEDLFYILMSGLKTKLEHWKYFELVTGEKRRHKYESFMCSIMMLSRGRAPPCARQVTDIFEIYCFSAHYFYSMEPRTCIWQATFTLRKDTQWKLTSLCVNSQHNWQCFKSWKLVLSKRNHWYLKFLQPSYFKYESERKYWYKIPFVWDFICIL